MIRFGSLFAGIGGFDLGFERAGMECVWQVENDRFCNRVLAAHWPNVRRIGDIAAWAPDPEADAVDLICGGFPCQDLSVAGKRAGLSGNRSGLFWELVRVVSVLRPEWLVLENVPGLLSSKQGRDMATVFGELADLGYGVGWRVLDSQYFNVAQRRARLYFVGHPDPRRAAAVLFEPEGGARDAATVRETGADIAGTLAPGAHPSGFNGQDAERNQLVAATLRGRSHGEGVNEPGRGGEDDQNLVCHSLSSEGADGSEDGTGRGTPIIALRTDHGSSNGRPWGKLAELHGHNASCVAVSTDEPSQQQRPDDGSGYAGVQAFNWQSGGSRPRFGLSEISDALHVGQTPAVFGSPPDSDRVRTATGLSGPLDLCESCQKGPDAPRYRAIGNAVTVQVAEWIGRRIVACNG